jgi:hypothetical protein|nr:MAG TPA: hypothetical protein [Caudoviricetes sp.]
MIHYDETRGQRYSTEWEDVVRVVVNAPHRCANDFNIGELANVLWHYEIPSQRYYEVRCEDINTGAIEGCVLVPHTQYVLRDKTTGEGIIVSGYTPPGPIEWFFRGATDAAFRGRLAWRLINAMRDGQPDRFTQPGYELIPIP